MSCLLCNSIGIWLASRVAFYSSLFVSPTVFPWLRAHFALDGVNQVIVCVHSDKNAMSTVIDCGHYFEFLIMACTLRALSRNGVRASGPSTFDFIQIKSSKCSIKVPMSRAFTDATHKIFYSEPIPFGLFLNGSAWELWCSLVTVKSRIYTKLRRNIKHCVARVLC